MKKLPLVLLEFLWLFWKNEEDCKLAKAERALGWAPAVLRSISYFGDATATFGMKRRTVTSSET